MLRFGVRVAKWMALLGLASLGVWGVYRASVSHQPATDATERFLARHWEYPLAPQGEPPAGFTALEASLAPDACGRCHPAQYADWRASLHSRSIGPGILWQFRVLSQAESNGCLRCHAPLAEQKALMALQQNWTNAPRGPIPPYVSGDLHLRGLVCAACHVRRHMRYGPPPNAQATRQAGDRPHEGFRAEPAFQDSRFCAVCHQFPPEGRKLAGKLIENTFEEWRASPAAAKGLACPNCHMRERRHLWRGIHDPEMVASGLRRELDVKRVPGDRIVVRGTITSVGVGHYFPTYVVPKVTVSLHLRDDAGTREIARQVIARTVSLDLDREISDTRIPPGGKSLIAAEVELPHGAKEIEMRVEVAPSEHYARMFQSMLERRRDLDAATQSLLREALQQAVAATYRLTDLRVAIPTSAGAPHQAVAN